MDHSPEAEPAPERLACGTCDKTFKTLRTRHQHLARYKHVLPEPLKINMEFRMYAAEKTIRCPICPFKAKKATSPKSLVTHFGTEHEGYTLEITYFCAPCGETMTAREAMTHSEKHKRATPTPSPATSPSTSSSQDSCSNPSTSPDQDPPSSPPSLTIDDTQLPQHQKESPPNTPPTPEFISQTPSSDLNLMRLFLEACDENITQPQSETLEACNEALPSTDHQNSLSVPQSQDQPPTDSPAKSTASSHSPTPESPHSPDPATNRIPPLMENIIQTPQPLPRPNRRPRAVDFFGPEPTPAAAVPTTPPPRLDNLNDDGEAHQPPRPTHLHTSTTDQSSTPPLSPLTEDPTTATFPSSTTADSLKDFRLKWSLLFDTDLDLPSFTSLCSEFISEGLTLARTISSQQRPHPKPRRQDRPSARPPIDGRRPNRADPTTAKRLQHLYRISKKRAARKVLGEDSPSYEGSLDQAFEFFSSTFGHRSCNEEQLKQELLNHVPTTDVDPTLFEPPTPEEIAQKLRSMSNSAPGRDRLEYRHIRILDPKGELLAKIYHHCFLFRDVPQPWKEATTILIHKKESTHDPSNFRPIALMACVYKLLMSIIAKRMTSHAINHDLLSPEQKSARPSEGCYEHSFLLTSLVDDARRINKKLNLAWLDIRNAFGSIPHSALLTTLSHMGFPAPLITMIKNAYTGATTTILTPHGPTESIPIHSGVKQGCPLSAILFNLTLELILRKAKAAATNSKRGPAKHHGMPLSILAYADDLVVISRNKDSLQHLLDTVSQAANILNLQFRPDKCASLSLTTTTPHIELNDFRVQGNIIPALAAEEHYRYLGIPIGLLHNVTAIDAMVDELIDKLTRIEESLLAPWQKLDMIRTFIQPCLTYAFRAGRPLHHQIKPYRTKLIKVVRNICSLQNNATTHYFFAARQTGGLGLQDPIVESDIQKVVQAVKILNSNDPTVAAIAKSELQQSVRFATQSNPTPSLISNFLSNCQSDRRLDKLQYRRGSHWTRTREATKRLGVNIHVPATGPPTLSTTEYVDPILPKDACRFLHNLARESESISLRELRDQGKVARALHHDKFGNGSTWHYTGLNLRFKDWRFIHRARLNVCPTNSVKARFSDSQAINPNCRHCYDTETLPHVLCHCLQNMPAILARHNRVVNRLVNAVRTGSITTDKTVTDSNSLVRPDIVIQDDNKAIIIDVCCPFENGAEALEEAVTRKELKYQHLQEHFAKLGLSCDVFGFAVGALGTWHPGNEKVLNALGMSRRYKNLFRKLCCTDVIQGSTDIYRQHLGCDIDA